MCFVFSLILQSHPAAGLSQPAAVGAAPQGAPPSGPQPRSSAREQDACPSAVMQKAKPHCSAPSWGMSTKHKKSPNNSPAPCWPLAPAALWAARGHRRLQPVRATHKCMAAAAPAFQLLLGLQHLPAPGLHSSAQYFSFVLSQQRRLQQFKLVSTFPAVMNSRERNEIPTLYFIP